MRNLSAYILKIDLWKALVQHMNCLSFFGGERGVPPQKVCVFLCDDGRVQAGDAKESAELSMVRVHLGIRFDLSIIPFFGPQTLLCGPKKGIMDNSADSLTGVSPGKGIDTETGGEEKHVENNMKTTTVFNI